VSLTIGKLAVSVGVSTDALRYYEREGLIAPTAKTRSGYRLYASEAVRHVRFIKRAQQCGFSLAEIAQLLALRASDGACCGDVRRVAIEKKLQLEARIRDMATMSRALDVLIADCNAPDATSSRCPILDALDRQDTSKGGARKP